MVSKLILGRSKIFSLFNSIGIDFGHFFVNYISKSDFDQYYQITSQIKLSNINHFTSKSVLSMINSTNTKSNMLLEASCHGRVEYS